MRSTLFVTLLIVLFQQITAQDTLKTDTTKYWEIGGLSSLNFSQLYVGDDWAAGGESSISGLTILNLHANYKKKNSSWDNLLDLNLGFTKINGGDYRKSDDKLDIASKYGKRASKKWNYSGLLGFSTQLLDGYNFPNDSIIISRFMAPGYLVASIGLDYRPAEGISILISPLTGKMTFVLDKTLSDKGAFGVSKGEKIRNEMGASVKASINKEIIKNVTVNSKLVFFSNFFARPEHIDIEWQLLLTFKVNAYISTNISTNMVYDHDIVQKLQFKEFLGIGITYKFTN